MKHMGKDVEDGETRSLRCRRAHQHHCRGKEIIRQSSALQACIGLAGKVLMKPTSAVWEGIFPLHYILPHSCCSAMWALGSRVCFGRGAQAAGRFCPRQAKALLLLHNVLTVPHLQHLQQKYFLFSLTWGTGAVMDNLLQLPSGEGSSRGSGGLGSHELQVLDLWTSTTGAAAGQSLAAGAVRSPDSSASFILSHH